MSRAITIVTRGSDLALWQARHVRDLLVAASPDTEVSIVDVKTKGDEITHISLAKIGGKALFVKEIQAALLDGRADVAVHSMKDVPGDEDDPRLHMAAVSTRGNPGDALVSRNGETLDALPQGARVGTSSMRRQSLLLARRPDLEIELLRGNVPTRLAKLDRGDYDAIVLACAGLERLGLDDRITEEIDHAVMLPAVGQGALGIEVRADDDEAAALVARAANDPDEERRIAAERSFLARLGGSCQTPIAGHAVFDGDELVLDGLVARPDGSEILRDRRRGSRADAEAMGTSLADELLERGARAIIEASREA